MLFVTETFLGFFLVVYVIYWLLPARIRPEFLIVSSLFFYATWSTTFAVHFIVVVTVNYCAMELWRAYRKNWIFWSLQIANVLNLAFFKYFYFLADVLGFTFQLDVLRAPHLQLAHRVLGMEILLPLAISFYTFQVMAYGIDIFRGVYAERHTFREVLLFKLFFPQLIAGPIMRSAELLPQTITCRRGFPPDADKMKGGLWLILTGIVKKVVVADMLLEFAAPVLGTKSPYDVSVGSTWLAVMALMLMLYADFSAYSDLARGFGFMLGFTIPINFKAPFFMHSLSDFWRRWHLTFSLWIRDYIFIPLGGSRVSEWRVYVNFTITFLLGGLWHGASYSFVVWGTLIGVILSVENFLDRRGIPETPKTLWGRVLRGLVTYSFYVPISALFFAPSFDWAVKVVLRLYGAGGSGGRQLENPLIFVSGFVAVLAFHFAEEKPDLFRRLRRYESWLLPVSAFAVTLLVLQFSGGAKDFFYFQF